MKRLSFILFFIVYTMTVSGCGFSYMVGNVGRVEPTITPQKVMIDEYGNIAIAVNLTRKTVHLTRTPKPGKIISQDEPRFILASHDAVQKFLDVKMVTPVRIKTKCSYEEMNARQIFQTKEEWHLYPPDPSQKKLLFELPRDIANHSWEEIKLERNSFSSFSIVGQKDVRMRLEDRLYKDPKNYGSYRKDYYTYSKIWAYPLRIILYPLAFVGDVITFPMQLWAENLGQKLSSQ